MANELLICPDCGGIIGSQPAGDEGRPCTCFKDSSSNESSKDATVSTPKICCKCGADVTSTKRLHDSEGYWCYACHKEDQRLKSPKGVACADCGRVVPESALMHYENLLICSKCRFDRNEVVKRERKFRPKVGEKHFEEADKNRLYVMLGIVGILMVIIILSQLHVFGR